MINSDHLHPIIVHFPIALIIVGFFADVASLFFKSEKCLSKTGFYLMVLGSLAALAAWSSGHLFTEAPTQGDILTVYIKHKTAALGTMILIFTGTIFRIWLVLKKREETSLKWIVLGFYLLSFIAVTFTGFMGGKMVYDLMLGQ